MIKKQVKNYNINSIEMYLTAKKAQRKNAKSQMKFEL
jgi:hypothetical protein